MAIWSAVPVAGYTVNAVNGTHDELCIPPHPASNITGIASPRRIEIRTVMHRSLHLPHQPIHTLKVVRVVQTVLGTFNHVELARELDRRHLLETIYSTFPWARLRREGLPYHRVDTFPWIHTPQFLAQRYGLLPRSLFQHSDFFNRRLFDRHVLHQTARKPAPDVLIAGSGSVYHAALALQHRGTRWICDRASTHQRSMQHLLTEESLRWGLQPQPHDPRILHLEEQSYEHADAITVPSRSAAQSFLDQGVPASKLHILPYGVRLQNFSPQVVPADKLHTLPYDIQPENASRQPSRPANTFHVLFLGNVSLRKGVPYLLKAFAALNHSNKHLTIAGHIQPDLHALLPTLPINNVSFIKHVPYRELPALLSRHHLLALPSIEDGFGLVLPMALACGTPVLVSTAAGSSELIHDGVEGFTHAPRDTQSMTARMTELAEDRHLHARMSAAALARVQTLNGWTHYGDLWQSLLQPSPPNQDLLAPMSVPHS